MEGLDCEEFDAMADAPDVPIEERGSVQVLQGLQDHIDESDGTRLVRYVTNEVPTAAQANSYTKIELQGEDFVFLPLRCAGERGGTEICST